MQKLKKPVSVLLTIIMVVSLFTVIPTPASAAEAVEYVFRSWDADQNKAVDHYGTCTSYTTIRSTSSALTLTSGWYVVNGNADITEHRITVSGEVHLILLSGTMDCEYGIRLSEGNSLYVYPGKNSSGTLNARTGSDEEANIGGNESENCGEFVFYGGTLKARNNDRCSGGAAIGGGGNGGNCGTLSFYGGTVDAKNSGAATAEKSYGAAIGCGNDADSGGSGCCINIYGGTITADNGSYSNGAGIGGGEDSKCAPINILGGEIEAKAYNGAAIGSGQGGTSNTITIKNAIIKKAESNFGAGIGSGEDSDCESIVIDNSYVNAYTVIKNGGTGGEGAGIGGGNCGKSKNIKITRSVIVAASGRYGAGIGGGDESDGGDTEITDSAVFACSAQGGAGIGGGDEKGCGTITLKNSFIVVATDSEQNVSAEKFINSYGDNYNTIMQSISNPAISSQAGFYAAGNLVAMMFDYIITGTHTGAGIGSGDSGTADHINIDNCTVYSVAGECAAGIGGGDEGSFVEINIKDSVIESQGGKFGAGIGTGDFAKSCGTINIESSTVTAKGGSEGAGIGSGNQIDGSPTIIINDSRVVANGGTKYAAGIGGGDAGNGGNITIKNDSNVEAYGGTDAAGIGGGEGGDGGNITIEDSNVHAEGRSCGAGIGNGEDGDETNINIYGDSRVEAYAGNSDASAIGHGDNGIFYGHHVTTTFSSELKVKAGSSDRSTSLYYGSTRHDAVWNNPYALVYLCEHENTEWWGQNSDMHELRCRDCGKWLTSREAHQWDENDVCTVCGGERRTLTLTFIEKDKNGQEVRTVKAIDGYSAYTLPECENVPDGYGFLYWKVSDGGWRDYYYPPGERLTASLVSPVAEAVYLPLKETKYIDKNGVEKTVMAKQVSALESTEYLLLVTDGWYVIDQNLPILAKTRCYGDVKFIVEDGCTWSERGNSRDDFLTGYHRGHSTFSLYGQKNQTGSINGGYTRGVSLSSYTQYGANLRCYTALFEESCKIFGGGFYSYDVTAVYNGELLIDGGNCYFTGLSGDKSVAQIGWTKPTDRISFSLLEGESPIKIKDGQAFRDNNGNIYENEITLEQMAALSVGYNDKTLTPYIEHNYGEPEWVWQNEYRDATAVFRCTDAGCDDVREIKAKVKCEDSGRNRTATAYCTFNGQEYSTTQTFRIIFDITVADCENGTVTASKSTARQDEAIDLEITPDEHYVLNSLTVTDAEDNPIAVTDNTFIMPASDVRVEVVFKRKKSYPITICPAEHGTVTASVNEAFEGDEVTLNISPDEDCRLQQISAIFADADSAEKVNLTALSGDGEGGEGYAKLLDGNSKTKWCIGINEPRHIIMKADAEVCMTGYSLTTGNDNASGWGHGRNWKDYTIYGANFASDSEAVRDSAQWQVIKAVENDSVTQDVNRTKYDYPPEAPAAPYQYYKIEITSNKGGSSIQMSEFEIQAAAPQELPLSGEGNTRTFTMPEGSVTVNAVFEPDLYTITWKNDDGAVIDTTQVLYGSTPSHASPVKESDEEYRYEFNGWYPALTPVTGDTEYTATFRAVEKSYFKGHSLSLKGDLVVNFYLGLTDQEIADGATVDFVWTVDGKEKTHSVTLTSADKTPHGYKASCPIAVAEMTYIISAALSIDGNTVETDQYSAVTYANVILSLVDESNDYIDEQLNGDLNKYLRLKSLVASLLDYGSKAQLRFDRNINNLANGGTDYYSNKPNIPYNASEMNEHLSDCGLEYVGTSVIYLSQTTLRHYYRIVDPSKFTDEIKNGITFDGEAVTCGVKNGMIYFDKKDIAASQLDTEYVIRINGHEYHYSALDYSALAYSSDDTPYENSITKQLAAAVYRYNQAANEYFAD